MKIGLILGSASDYEVARQAEEMLEKFGVDYETKVLSAHRSPEKTYEFARYAENNGYGVLIAFAGKAAHLAGTLAALSTLPVIGVPVKGDAFNGMDALLSTVQMPKGVPVATVAVDGGKNAAILGVEILALGNNRYKDKLRYYKQELANEVDQANRNLK